MTYLLILAAGAGTRNKMFTYNNALPKVLMSVGDKTCLEAIIDSYKNVKIDQTFIACQKRHSAAIHDIVTAKGLKNIACVAYDEEPTAMASVYRAFADMSKLGIDPGDHNWFINWSDCFADEITLPSEEDMNDFDIIFCDTKLRHRNNAMFTSLQTSSVVDDKLRIGNEPGVAVVSTLDQNGNVPGIFYVHGSTLNTLFDTEEHVHDILEHLTDFDALIAGSNCRLSYLESVNDIGDYAKYSQYMMSKQSDAVCRYFNELKIESDKVLKRPVTPYGEKLHAIELAYYQKFGTAGTALAKLLGYDKETKTMTLERLHGQTCQSIVDKLQSDRKLARVNNLIKKFNEQIALTHSLPCELPDGKELRDSIWAEFYYAIDKRVQPCVDVINAVIEQNDIKTVDGMPICSYDAMMTAVHEWVQQKLDEHWFEFGVTHGDPNTDNTMLCNQAIRFVDPRGYFGQLASLGQSALGIGVKQYDLAKFAYGFSGYSKLNRSEFIATNVNNGNIDFFVGVRGEEKLTDVSIFDMRVSNDIKVLVGIIWVKLTSYIINDPMKSVAAYLYGNALLTKLLNIK